jgi:hypothetical protein
MTPTTVEQLSRAEFQQLSADERREHVQNTLTALRQCIPQSGAAAGAFIDARLYVQELAGWAPGEIGALWPLHRAGIEDRASEIHAAFQEALDSGSLSPAQAQFAKQHLVAEARPIDGADEYL